MTKCVERQFRNGHTVSHPISTSQTTPMTANTTLVATAELQWAALTTAAPKVASAVASTSTRTGPINRFQ